MITKTTYSASYTLYRSGRVVYLRSVLLFWLSNIDIVAPPRQIQLKMDVTDCGYDGYFSHYEHMYSLVIALTKVLNYIIIAREKKMSSEDAHCSSLPKSKGVYLLKLQRFTQ